MNKINITLSVKCWDHQSSVSLFLTKQVQNSPPTAMKTQDNEQRWCLCPQQHPAHQEFSRTLQVVYQPREWVTEHSLEQQQRSWRGQELQHEPRLSQSAGGMILFQKWPFLSFVWRSAFHVSKVSSLPPGTITEGVHTHTNLFLWHQKLNYYHFMALGNLTFNWGQCLGNTDTPGRTNPELNNLLFSQMVSSETEAS